MNNQLSSTNKEEIFSETEKQESAMNKFQKLHNQFYNEECLAGMAKLPDQCIDMVLCDLPFGITRNAWDCPISTEALFNEYKRIVKPTGAILQFASQPFDKFLGCEGNKIIPYKYEWIWEKNKATGHLNAKKAPLRAHENILVFYSKTPIYNPQARPQVGSFDGFTFTGHEPMHAVKPRKLTEKELKNPLRNYGHAHCSGNPGGTTERNPRSVLHFQVENNDSKSKFHPTQKPIALLEYLIKTFTKKNDLVLDNCMGSGSTAIACLESSRFYLGYEASEEYYKLAKKRIDTHVKSLI